jgi:hypothetical protein
MSKYAKSANRRESKTAQWQLAKTWQFPLIFPEELLFCLYFKKIRDTLEKLKNSQRLLF